MSVGGPIEGPPVRNRVNVVRDVLSKYYIIEDTYIQGWPEKDQSSFDHLVLTGLNHLIKPNFDHLKWSKLKNQDFL